MRSWHDDAPTVIFCSLFSKIKITKEIKLREGAKMLLNTGLTINVFLFVQVVNSSAFISMQDQNYVSFADN